MWVLSPSFLPLSFSFSLPLSRPHPGRVVSCGVVWCRVVWCRVVSCRVVSCRVVVVLLSCILSLSCLVVSFVLCPLSFRGLVQSCLVLSCLVLFVLVFVFCTADDTNDLEESSVSGMFDDARLYPLDRHPQLGWCVYPLRVFFQLYLVHDHQFKCSCRRVSVCMQW
jgi:hypothetical protein